MRVVITAKTWAPRNELVQIWVDRVKASAKEAGWDAEVIVCGSDGCKPPTGAHYIEAPNTYLTAKSNALLAAAREYDPDWYMYTGDDDLVSANFCSAYNPWLGGDFDLVSWDDLYIYSQRQQQLFYWPGYDKNVRDESIGAGRMLSRKLCDALDWQHTDSVANVSLDLLLTQRMRELTPWAREKRLRMGEEGVMMVDVKDGHSITAVGKFKDLQPISMSEQARRVLGGLSG